VVEWLLSTYTALGSIPSTKKKKRKEKERKYPKAKQCRVDF
jgi:hypothetical protein